MATFTLPQNNVIAGQSGHLTDHDDIYAYISNVTNTAILNVQNTQYSGGAKGDGVTDDTVAIQAAINAAQALTVNSLNTGAVVLFPPGIYVISAPLLITANGITLLGTGPGSTMGGGGSGTGTFTPGVGSGITGVLLTGTVIAPSGSFAIGGAHASACVLIDGSGGAINRDTVERITFYAGNAGTVTVHGVATWGAVNAARISNCHFLVFYSTGSHGVALLEDATPKDADGTTIESCLAQFIGKDGFHLGPFGDGTIVNCHAQTCGSYGFYISDSTGYTTGGGGNIRVLNCRGDLCTLDGFFFGVSCGSFLGMIQVDNCSTQRNVNNGFHMTSLASTKTCQVYLSNCVAQGDGTDASSSGFRVNGPCYTYMSNCAVHVNTIDVGAGVPVNAITTALTTQAPQALHVLGGFYNARTSFLNIVGASTPTVLVTNTSTFLTGQATFSSAINSYSNTNTSGNAPVLTPSFANGTAAQLSDTTQDYMVYLEIGTGGTAFIVAIGPTSTPANTVVSSGVATSGEVVTVRLPAGWFLKWSATTATLANQKAIGC